MKYLVIGLGNFGATLACQLTDAGHDVIGIDNNEHRVEEVKERIAVSYIMDATEKNALRSLPLEEMDCIIVAIGQSMEYALRTVAILKELGQTKIYARALDYIHMSILKAMNIQQICIPENLAAMQIAKEIGDKNL